MDRGVTGQVAFDSHVVTLVEVSARLVNGLTAGWCGGHRYEVPSGGDCVQAAASALGGHGRRTPHVALVDADAFTHHAIDMRQAFQAAHDGDLAGAALTINALLARTGARPQLDPLSDGGWHVHFHGTDDTLVTGWVAGCVTSLALAVGSSLAGRLGVCGADRCDRVYVDTSKNGSRRFCTTSCQNRVKAAAFRARK